MKQKKKKRSVTLIEIMIVIMLIGLIGGALAFNMRGSVEKGKIFKTEQNIARVYDALMMASATGEFNIDSFDGKAILKALENSVLIKNADKVLLDAWGSALTIVKDGNDLKVTSTHMPIPVANAP